MAEDPNTTAQMITYGGMAVGAAVAAFVVRMGWRKGATTARSHDMMISGSAEITDMGPIKELVANLGLLVYEIAELNKRMTDLATDIRTYIREMRDEKDIEEEVQRRVNEITARDRATRSRYARENKKPTET